ncbi:hypothetical protein [Selenomonas ruminantium]|uniref:tetratricopeptide repeat protein n=1 Tax=Selenomonas ruminantium TaxID=971 RepID=UPI0015693A44|nr:hypothetical protein [Selenomonas ruminantium]
MKIKVITILSLIIFLFHNYALASINNHKDKIQEISNVIKTAKLNNENVDYPRLYIERGKYYSQIDEYDNAMMDFNRVIQMNNVPGYWIGMAYYGRAYIYDKFLEYDKVISNLNEAIKVNPKFYDAYAQRAIAYKNKKDYKRALSDISIAINESKSKTVETARYYAVRAGIYEKIKEYDKEIADYTVAIKLDPENDAYYLLRGSAYYWHKKDYISDIEDTTKRIELLKKNNSTRYNIEQAYSWRASLYTKLKRYDMAVSDYSQAIQYADKTPNNNIFLILHLLHRGCLYAILNENKKAIEDFDEAEKHSDKITLGRVYFAKALYFYNLGENEITINYLRKSMMTDKSFDKAKDMYNNIMENNPSCIITFENFLSEF